MIPSLQDAAKTIRDQALHGWAGAAEKLRGAGASVQKVSPAMGSLQVENIRLKIGKDNHRDVAMGYILLSMCCCRSFISQTRQSYNVPVEAGEREARAWEALASAVNNVRRNSRFILSGQQPAKPRTVHEWSERTSALIQAENRLFWLSSISKTSFLGLMTGCGKNKKIKSGRSHDRCSGLPRGWRCCAAGLPSECADKAGLRADASSLVMPLIK